MWAALDCRAQWEIGNRIGNGFHGGQGCLGVFRSESKGGFRGLHPSRLGQAFAGHETPAIRSAAVFPPGGCAAERPTESEESEAGWRLGNRGPPMLHKAGLGMAAPGPDAQDHCPFEAVRTGTAAFFPKPLFTARQFACRTGDRRRLTSRWNQDEIVARTNADEGCAGRGWEEVGRRAGATSGAARKRAASHAVAVIYIRHQRKTNSPTGSSSAGISSTALKTAASVSVLRAHLGHVGCRHRPEIVAPGVQFVVHQAGDLLIAED